MITGFTSDKLDLVRTYNNTNPFQVGINGVTSIGYNNSTIPPTITSVSYTIGDINYVTYDPQNTNIYSNRRLTKFKTLLSGYDFEPYSNQIETQNTFDIKEEGKMGLVFQPKVDSELFIERQSISVFERHSRLSRIRSFGALENYRNGYYIIIQET